MEKSKVENEISEKPGQDVTVIVKSILEEITAKISDETSNKKKELLKDASKESPNIENVEVQKPYPNPIQVDPSRAVYKIEITHLPRQYKLVELRVELRKLRLNVLKVKGVSKSNHVFVTFRNEDDRQSALTAIVGYTWRKTVLQAKAVNFAGEPLTGKRPLDSPDDKDPKKQKFTVEDSVTPLAYLPYEKQLDIKQNDIHVFIATLTKAYSCNYQAPPDWLSIQKSENDGKCCRVERIRPSPIIDGYRNKCVFAIGLGETGTENVVGFRVGGGGGGSLGTIVNPLGCKNIPSRCKQVLEFVQLYVDQSSLEVYNLATRKGHWSLLIVRTTEGSDVMVTLQLHPQIMRKTEIEKEVVNLKNFFCDLFLITSMFLQVIRPGVSGNVPAATKLHHVFGPTFVTESLFGLKFRISNISEFQVNTKATEVLIETAGECAGINKNTILLDICSDIGTIGQSLSTKVRRVIGIEYSKPTFSDAEFNARQNGIKNIEYHGGDPEDLLPTIIDGIKSSEEIIAIVNPPRSRRHQKLLHALRKCARIKKLVFLSSNPFNSMHNFLDLCRPASKKFRGNPFRLVKMIPIDLCPHTKHCDVVVLFERNVVVDPQNGGDGDDEVIIIDD